MFTRLLHLVACIFLGLSLPGCVSFNVGKEIPKSKGVLVREPGRPFREVVLAGADRAWKSDSSGNTISYFSECSNQPSTLERFRNDSLVSLPGASIRESKSIDFDGREGLHSLVEGKVDGIPVRLSLVNYQKNGCSYALTYVARPALFESEVAEFNRFTEGFKAP